MTRAYRTVSGEAALLLADIVPGFLLAEERADIYRWKKRELTYGELATKKAEARGRSIDVWHAKWAATKRIVSDVTK